MSAEKRAVEFLDGKALKRGNEPLKINSKSEGTVPVFAVIQQDITNLIKEVQNEQKA